MFFNERTAAKYANQLAEKPLAVELEPELLLIAEQQARASHEGWMKGKIAQGYVYGIETNDDPSRGELTTPLLIPYDDLDEETKKSNIANAVAVIKILRNKGTIFGSFTQLILYPIAKEIHDEWAREKISNGWTWGPVTDKSQKIHRDLVPFEVLATTPELNGDIAYDVATARQVIMSLISENDIFPFINNIENFASATTI